MSRWITIVQVLRLYGTIYTATNYMSPKEKKNYLVAK